MFKSIIERKISGPAFGFLRRVYEDGENLALTVGRDGSALASASELADVGLGRLGLVQGVLAFQLDPRAREAVESKFGHNIRRFVRNEMRRRS